jgi:hypothetical protein
MLARAVRMEAVDPEDRIIDPITHTVRTFALRQLHRPPQPERSSSRF